MIWARCAPWLALAAVLLAAPAAAQTLEESWRCCTSVGDSSLVIGSRTAVIESGRETDARLATAFTHRGAAHRRRGEYARAIQDRDQAIRLNPSHALAFSNRGHAHPKSGCLDAAIADCDAALRHNPDSPHALYRRGLARRRKGDQARGAADIAAAKAIQADVVEVMAMLGVR